MVKTFSRLIRRASRTLIVGGCLLLALPAYSTFVNCRYQDIFFVSCTQGSCAAIFRARDIHADGLGICDRRLVVEPAPDGSLAVLKSQIKEMPQMESQGGVYAVNLRPPYIEPEPQTTNQLSESLKSGGAPEPAMVQALDPGTDIEKLKGDWGAQSTTEFGHTVKVWAIPIALLGFTRFVIFSTTAMFRESVKARGIPGSPHPGIWLPLIVQLLLFLITAPAAAAITGLPLFSLVAVIQLGVWLYELVLLFTS